MKNIFNTGSKQFFKIVNKNNTQGTINYISNKTGKENYVVLIDKLLGE